MKQHGPLVVKPATSLSYRRSDVGDALAAITAAPVPALSGEGSAALAAVFLGVSAWALRRARRHR